MTPSKQQKILERAKEYSKEGGKNIVAFLLEFIVDLEEKVAVLQQKIEQEPPEDERVEKVALRLASKISAIGEDGHTPTNEELLALIKPLIPIVKDGKTPTKEELLALIRPLIPKVQNGETPSDERLLALIAPLIPPAVSVDEPKIIENVADTVEKRLPALGTAVRDGLELLQGDERLDASAIKDLDKFVKKFATVGAVQYAGIHQKIDHLDATETPNGAITAFTFATKPKKVIVNGSSYREGHGWTWTNGQAVIDFAPPTGSDIYGEIFM